MFILLIIASPLQRPTLVGLQPVFSDNSKKWKNNLHNWGIKKSESIHWWFTWKTYLCSDRAA
ncbi:MAG: hypothetical protein R2795_07800 [Saprospiraceae bacterium]